MRTVSVMQAAPGRAKQHMAQHPRCDVQGMAQHCGGQSASPAACPSMAVVTQGAATPGKCPPAAMWGCFGGTVKV